MESGDRIPDELLTIGSLAARTGVSVSAIRFYERKGLISSIRVGSSHRRFHRSTIRRLSVVIVCQRLGYSLAEIHDRLGMLPSERIPDGADWTELSTGFRAEIDNRIERLLTLRDHLDGCIGCGCLSLDVCMLYNPEDAAADLGPGPRYLMGETSADLPSTDLQSTDLQSTDLQSTDLQSTDLQSTDLQSTDLPSTDLQRADSTAAGPASTATAKTPRTQETDTVSDSTETNTADWHIAQINIGRLLHPVDDPRIAEFVDNLDPINALAEAAPGFVWRLQDDSGNATAIRVFDDPNILPNFSVWESIDALKNYVFKTDHARFLRRRREWFKAMDDMPVLTMWWVPAGHIPTIEEAKERIDHLAEHGPTEKAFTFHPTFDPPTV